MGMVMGINWCRMSPKPDTDRGELLRLIEQQAIAFQGMPYYWATDPVETPDSYHENTRRQYEEQYLASSRALEGLLEFPHCDPDTGTANDDPTLDPSMRVYPITHNTIFPPQWRLQAHRTFLPEQLPGQIAIWKNWITDISEGCHRHYLLDLYLHETTMRLATHCQDLQSVAEGSLSKTAKWVATPDLVAVRKRIASFPIPTIYPAPVVTPLASSEQTINLDEHSRYQFVCSQMDDLISLTRSWDRRAKDDWKVRYYQDHYQTFQQYLDQYQDEWLRSFFTWADTCCSKGFGLFLDY